MAIIISEVWTTTPFMALLLLGGLAPVPDELHEAAKVDGASARQRFWRITIPLMKPAILVALLFRTLDARPVRRLARLIIPYMTFALPLSIFTLSAFFREIPWELEQAAQVDGATPFQAFFKVIAPLAAPGAFTTAILVFLFCWNDFVFAISLTSTSRAETVPAAIASFPGASQFTAPIGSIAAAAVVVTIPIIVILVGPSGGGKSTALRMVAGLEDISGGQLRIGGEVVNDRAPKDRDIAMVFQNYALYPHMTVRENMGFALNLAKTPQAEIDRKVDEVAKVLDLEPHLDRKPANLSGGQRQRVAMGRAIVRDPKASSPTNLFVAGFVGSPSMNFLPGELAEGVVKLPIGDVKLSDEVRRGVEGASGPSSGRNVIAGLRPEHFEDAALLRDRSGTGFPTTISVLESTTHISTSNPTASPRVSSTSWPRTRAPATSPTRARRRRSWLGSTQRARSGRASRASCGSTLGACSCSTPRAVAA